MQLDPYDFEDIMEDVGEIIRGRENPITLRYDEVIEFDPYTENPTSVSGVSVPLSGVIGHIREEDRILKMSGHLKVGDTKLTFYKPDLIALVDIGRFFDESAIIEAPSGSGKLYIVDVMDEWGIKEKNKVVFGLVESKGSL